MLRNKAPVNVYGDRYIYVTPSFSNDKTIQKINKWAGLGYKVITSTPGMIIMEKRDKQWLRL